jgi:branched-chain amino acid transport system permease protein
MVKKKKGVPTLLAYLINLLLFIAFLTVINSLIDTEIFDTYFVKIIMLIGINIILTVSLNLATGFLGQLYKE